MGLRKKIIAVLEQQGLDVNQAVLKISAIVREPKKAKFPNMPTTKPLGTFEIRKEVTGEGEEKYRIDSFSDVPLPISAIVVLESAINSYKEQVAICDCAECKKEATQLKSRGAV